MTNSSTALFLGIFKGVAGSGVLAMPWCFMRAGWVVSLLLVIFVWAATVRTVVQVCRLAIQITPKKTTKPMIVEAAAETVDQVETSVADSSFVNKALCALKLRKANKGPKKPKEKLDPIGYGNLMEHSFKNERAGFWICWCCVIPCQWIASVAYIIFVAANSAPIFSSTMSPRYMTLVMTVIELALCMPKATGHLSFSSAFGNFAFFAGTGAMLVYSIAVKGLKVSNLRAFTDAKGAFEAFGILVFAFAAHTETLAVMAAATGKGRAKFPYLVFLAFLLALSIFVGFSFCVYAAFGDATNAVFFLNLPSNNIVLNILRLCVSLMLVCGYPLLAYPIFQAYEATGSTKEVDAVHTSKWSIIFTKKYMWRTLWRWLIIISTGVVAALVTDGFGPVSCIGGGLTAATSFILPPMFHILMSQRAIPRWSYGLDIFIILMGIVGGILSVATGVYSLFQN
ncbi:Proton-coupled amino acid transporter 1 [Perkinsela sp. CCAP 1560/4]|nr:Proton-coupled amino acid transporter [Perkinsela sp. CCAP 1560/4]KNH09043.1 Proton-coupled amino acid transporter 1 [Perkinsela sp. CCAP 1560/4]|eukprot:KNH03833.1 Proton-coupled amino acid transporter [Perkinsela sp. CCAP 1560/4]